MARLKIDLGQIASRLKPKQAVAGLVEKAKATFPKASRINEPLKTAIPALRLAQPKKFAQSTFGLLTREPGTLGKFDPGALFPKSTLQAGVAGNRRTELAADIALDLTPAVSFIGSTGKLTSEFAQRGGTISKLADAIREAKPLRAQQAKLYTAERAARSAEVSKIGQEFAGEAGFKAQLGALKGELPKVEFEGVRELFNQQEIDGLFNQVEQVSELLPFEKVRAKGALAKLLQEGGGQVPQESELALLKKVFPEDLVDAITSKTPQGKKILNAIGEVFNVPRAIMSSFDLSAPLRQGVFLVGRPKQWGPAFRDMFKYAFQPKAYDDLFEQIAKKETYPLMRQAKLSLTDMRSPKLAKREEAFMSNLAQEIPGIGKIVKASDRAYSGFLNKLRADVFEDMVKGSRAAGIGQTTKLHEDIAKFVNAATGRGGLGKLEGAAVALNSAFFSPRLMASRLNLLNPAFYVKLEPFARKQALKSLLTFAGLGTTVLGLSKLAGAEVENDARSADFGKVKVGNKRYDIWGGFQQYIRLGAQLVSGKVVSSTTGKEITLGEGYKPLTRRDIILRFFESKEAPIFSFVTALLRGEGTFGEPLDVPAEVADRFIPMTVSDMYEMYQEGELGVLSWLPAPFGVGTQTYGRQELVSGENLIGEPTVELRPAQSLGRDLSEKLFGKKALKKSSGYSVEAYFDQLLEMPRTEAIKTFDEIAEVNPDLAKRIATVAEERKQGVTIQDKTLKSKGVSSGERAQTIMKQLNKLDSREEKVKLWDEYVQKKIITEDVSKQLEFMLKQQQEKTGLKVNQPKFNLEQGVEDVLTAITPEAQASEFGDIFATEVTEINKEGGTTTRKEPPKLTVGEYIKEKLQGLIPRFGKKDDEEPSIEEIPLPENPEDFEKEEIKEQIQEPTPEQPKVDLSVDPEAINDRGRNPEFETQKVEEMVDNAIKSSAQKFQAPASLLYDIALQESHFNPNITNTTPEGKEAGNPSGLFQFTDGTWKTVLSYNNNPSSSLYQVLPTRDRFDPETNALAAAYLIKFGQLGKWAASVNVWGPHYTLEEVEQYFDQTEDSLDYIVAGKKVRDWFKK